MASQKELRDKADELEVQAKELRRAHQRNQSAGSSNTSGVDILAGIAGGVFWIFVLGYLLNSCS